MDIRAVVSRLGWVSCLLCSFLWAAAVQVPAAAQESSLTLQTGARDNPHTTLEDVEAGARVYSRSCVICHGADGKGGRGPDLTRSVYRHGSSDGALFRNILTGISGTGMPGIYRPDTDIWQVLSYLRSLTAQAEEVELPGNPRLGMRLYGLRGGCFDCHRIDGEGGRLGPDLNAVGWQRSPENLRESLVMPNEVISPAFRAVWVVTHDGEEARGILRNEDSYSVQILDELENLRSFMKSGLTVLEKPEASLMPSYDGFFNDRELDHLVAYLYSLKGAPQ